MNEILKIVLSLSLSGSIFILLLLLIRHFFSEKLSKRWQYYIWLVVIVRLLLPFTPSVSLVGNIFEDIEQYMEEESVPYSSINTSNNAQSEVDDTEDMAWMDTEDQSFEPEEETQTDSENLWAIWLVVAVILFIRKVTIYQSFVKYLHAGCMPVTEIEPLEALGRAMEQNHIKARVELHKNNLISSPLLIGFFHPCIVVPALNVPEESFYYTILHELTHYKRGDMFYKWLLQFTICMHWFNPLIYLMQHEIERECELSCDEHIISGLNNIEQRKYGDTLLEAVKMNGIYKNSLASVTLIGSKEILKERLKSIMNYKKKSKLTVTVTAIITILICVGANVTGAYAASKNQEKISTENSITVEEKQYSLKDLAKQYYEDNELIRFLGIFNYLNKSTQKSYCKKMINDDKVAFFATIVKELESDLVNYCAKKAYKDDKFTIFFCLIPYLSDEDLESWIEICSLDGRYNYLPFLRQYNESTMNEDTIEDETDEESNNSDTKANSADSAKKEQERIKEYAKFGIIKIEDEFFYKEEQVRFLLDEKADNDSMYVVVNPDGKVFIEVIRSMDGAIEKIKYLTKEEIKDRFGEASLFMIGEPEVKTSRLTERDASSDISKVIVSCKSKNWYVIEGDECNYVYYNGLSGDYAYSFDNTSTLFKLNIYDVGKTEGGYVLMSVEKDYDILIYYNDKEVSYTKISG